MVRSPVLKVAVVISVAAVAAMVIFGDPSGPAGTGGDEDAAAPEPASAACALVSRYDATAWDLNGGDDDARAGLLTEASAAAADEGRSELSGHLRTVAAFWGTSTAGMDAAAIERALVEFDRATAAVERECAGSGGEGPERFVSADSEEAYMAMVAREDLGTSGTDVLDIGYMICGIYVRMAGTPQAADDAVLEAVTEAGMTRAQATVYVLGAQVHLCPESLQG